MKEKDHHMTDFFEMIQALLEHNISLEQEKSTFDDFGLLDNECLYVIDFNENKLLYKKGFKNVLGYNDDEMDLNVLLNAYHPDDEEIISKVIRESMLYTMKNMARSKGNTLSLKYRRQKKDGSYITVLSHSSIYDLDKEGGSMKSITRLTDVSFANDFTNVKYSFEAEGLNKNAFDKLIYQSYIALFTPREIEVINEICHTGTNREIAENLCISEHTVATHRKNIYKKSGCRSVEELRLYCDGKGILSLKKRSRS